MAVSSSATRRPPARPPIRWDRVGRLCLLAMFAVVALLYVSPTISYMQTRSESARRQQETRDLEREKARLEQRKKVLSSTLAVENEARRRGMVKPGERAYVIKGLPKD